MPLSSTIEKLVSTMYMIQANNNALLLTVLDLHPDSLPVYQKHLVNQYAMLIERGAFDDETLALIDKVIKKSTIKQKRQPGKKKQSDSGQNPKE